MLQVAAQWKEEGCVDAAAAATFVTLLKLAVSVLHPAAGCRAVGGGGLR
jgi:hypothetical protein